MKKDYLFLCGAPRSGTTAIAVLVSAMTNTHIGVEMFTHAIQLKDRIELSTADFDESNLRTTLAKRFKPEMIDAQIARFEKAGVIGDKHPLYHRNLPNLNTAFPGCGVVFIFRDVTDVSRSFKRRFENPADSWKVQDYNAIHYWCEAAHNFLSFQEKHPERCFAIDFKKLFSGSFEDNAAQAHKLCDRLAKIWDVGSLPEPALKRLLSNSAEIKTANSWGEGEETQDLFNRYNAEIGKIKWTIDEYHDMHARLSALD